MVSELRRAPSFAGCWACLLTCLVLGFAARDGGAQTTMNHGGETENQVAPEDLPVPRRMKGIGNAHVPITASAEAQRWFDQGLNLLNDYWDYESARAFEQGVRVDPACAMCYWGLFKAQSFYHSASPGYAPASLARAMTLIDRVSERERLYLQATSAPFPQQGDIWRELVRKSR